MMIKLLLVLLVLRLIRVLLGLANTSTLDKGIGLCIRRGELEGKTYELVIVKIDVYKAKSNHLNMGLSRLK